jgi:hypothetical protein
MAGPLPRVVDPPATSPPHHNAESRYDPRVHPARSLAAELSRPRQSRIRANARVFHDPEAFITMVMLHRAGLAPTIPWATAT